MPTPLAPRLTFHVGSRMKQFRFAPVALGNNRRGFLAVHSACAEDDPYHKMFFLPSDTLKLSLFSESGDLLWRRDLGPGMIPGIWFCPVFVFDLDGDGADEVWLVANPNEEHALDYEAFVLEGLSAADGQVRVSRPWPEVDADQPLSHVYRNFIGGGYSRGRPRLVTCQGTYGPMQLQCFDTDLKQVWARKIKAGDAGARGSHMFPIVDLDGDGRDELFWGERCIDLDTGRDRWVGDRDAWRGHSDVIQPTRDHATGRWTVYTCREAGPPNGAVVAYDDRGRELWGKRGLGHMDMGWTARLSDAGDHLAYALEIGSKTAGPDGFKRAGYTERLFDMTGREREVTFPLYLSLPVDFDGDGRHELTYTGGERRGLVVDRKGEPRWQLEGEPAYGGKLLDAPGEQIVTWAEDGTVRLYACPEARDSDDAMKRYAHAYYAACLRLWAVGYNRTNLGGL